jgi:hypothetical protein
MTHTHSGLTKEERDEMVALKNAINYNPASVHPDKQERFTELFVRSLSFVRDV